MSMNETVQKILDDDTKLSTSAQKVEEVLYASPTATYDFMIWLRDVKQLMPTSYTLYKDQLMAFLVTKPNLLDLNCYNDYLVKHAIQKRSQYLYFMFKRFIEFTFGIESKEYKRLTKGLFKPQAVQNYKIQRVHLEEEDLLRVVNSFPDNKFKTKHQTLLLLESQTGLRIGALLTINTDAVFEEMYKQIAVIRINTVGKGRKLNVVYLFDDFIKEMFRKYIAYPVGNKLYPNGLDNYPFLTPSKSSRLGINRIENQHRLVQSNYQRYCRDLKIALKNAGIDPKTFSTHDLRRGFARRFYDKYKDIHALSRVLNHSDISTTIIYLQRSGLQTIDYHKEMQIGDQE